MAKLNQVIAIEKGVKSRVYGELNEIHKAGQKPDLFNGLARHYVPIDDAAAAAERLPPEHKHVQWRYHDVLERVRKLSTEGMNVTARREYTNTVAKADIVVDGETLFTNVPVGYLLFLEKKLKDLRTMFGRKEGFVSLDESEVWSLDPNDGLHKTQPTMTHRTKKLQRPIVKYAATEHHPAQTEMINEDLTVGHWNTVKQSGAIPRAEKEKIADRIEKLYQAVKQAREAANNVDEVDQVNPGRVIFNYLYGG